MIVFKYTKPWKGISNKESFSKNTNRENKNAKIPSSYDNLFFAQNLKKDFCEINGL